MVTMSPWVSLCQKSKLFEKSGAGKIKKPPTKPVTIEVYAVFSVIFFLIKTIKNGQNK